MIWIYRILFLPLFLISCPYYFGRMIRRGGYAKDFSHRFGCVPALPPRRAGTHRLWIQAVSVGETEAVVPLLRAFKERGDVEVVLTTTTSTAYKIIREKYADLVTAYACFPMDFLPFSAKAWRRFDPSAAVLMEGELWPEHIAQARSRGVPVFVVNARLSDRSFRRWRASGFIARRLLAQIDFFCAGTRNDFARFRALGVPAEKIALTGNMKFDAAAGDAFGEADVVALKKELGFPPDAPVLLGSSTWPGEEAMLLETFARARERISDLRLLICPRHAERRAEIVALLEKTAWRWFLRSRTKPEDIPADADVCVADTTGELRRLTRGAQRAHRVFGEMGGRCRADDFSPDVRGSAVRVDYAPLVVHRHAVYRRVAADEVLFDRYIPAAPRLEARVAAPGLALDAREGDLAYRAADFKQKDGERFSGPPRLREKRGEFVRQHAAYEIVPVVRRAPHNHVAHRAARKVAAPAGLSYFYEEFALVHARSSVPHKKLRSVPAADAEAKRMKFTPYPKGCGLLVHYLFFLLGKGGVDLLDEGVGLVLRLFLELLEVVLGYLAVLFELLESFYRVAADVADRHASLFRHLVDHLLELDAALLRKLGQVEADRRAVVLRSDAEARALDGLLYGLHRGLVPRRNDYLACLGHVDAAHVLDRSRRSEVVDLYLFDKRGVRSSGADAEHRALQVLHALFAARAKFVKYLLRHAGHSLQLVMFYRLYSIWRL